MDNKELIARLEPFVHGLGKAILREVRDALEAAQAEVARLQREVVNRNQRALDGDKAQAAFDALYAKSEALKNQQPVAWSYNAIRGNGHPSEVTDVTFTNSDWGAIKPVNVRPLYAAAGASPQPSVNRLVSEINYVQPVPDHCDRITWRNRYYHLPIAQPSQEADPNAPWLSEAHILCADHGIAPGHITDRIRALRDKLEQPSQALEQDPAFITLPRELDEDLYYMVGGAMGAHSPEQCGRADSLWLKLVARADSDAKRRAAINAKGRAIESQSGGLSGAAASENTPPVKPAESNHIDGDVAAHKEQGNG